MLSKPQNNNIDKTHLGPKLSKTGNKTNVMGI